MSSNKQHINEEHRLPEEWEEVVGKTQPKFNKSKEAVWSEMMGQIDEQPQETKVIQMNWFRYAAAAVLVLALASVSFMRFYTQTITAPAGQHASALLPDGSKVELNAASEINFHPYWWRFQREVKFEGEAFFEVKKGSDFSVVSEIGTTQVLGTSFNINSRNGMYKVYCKTGKVNVVVISSNLVIMPNEMAVANKDDKLIKMIVKNDVELLGWIDNRFVFNTRPLVEVVQELELQFDATIELTDPSLSDLKFTGSFEKPNDLKEALDIIGGSMDIEFSQTGTSTYILQKSTP